MSMCSEELHVGKQHFKHDSVFFGLHLYLMSLLIVYVCFYTPLTRGYDRERVYLDMALVLLGILLASPGMVAKWQDLRLMSAWHHYSFTVRCSLTFNGNDLKFKFQFILAKQKKKAD